MFFFLVFDIDEDIIEVNYHKNIEFFYQNLVDIALQYSWCVDQSKKHHVILKMAIVSQKPFSICLFF